MGLTTGLVCPKIRDMTTTHDTARTDAEAIAVAQTILDQIGRMNVLAISGGKRQWAHDAAGVEVVLPCGYGYEVRVRYVYGRDTYTVTRGYRKGLSYWVKGEMTDVYCDQVSEVAYRAGMFRDEWTTNGARKIV